MEADAMMREGDASGGVNAAWMTPLMGGREGVLSVGSEAAGRADFFTILHAHDNMQVRQEWTRGVRTKARKE